MLTHPYGRAPTGPLLSLLVEHLKVLNSRACLRILSLSLSLSVEHLKVMAALTVEPAYASLWSSPSGPLPYGRACLRIQFTYWVGGAMVERLRTLWSSDKSMAALSVEPPLSNKSLRAVERAFI